MHWLCQGCRRGLCHLSSCLWLIPSHCSCATHSAAPSPQVVGVPASEKVYRDLTSVEVAPSSLPCTAHRKVTPRQPIAEQPDVFELYPVT